MTRAALPLLLAAALAACSAAPPQNPERDAAQAADRAVAQKLAAAAPPEGQPLAPWLASERQRIEAERDAAERKFGEAEKACWRRFAVNTCLRDARLERRAVTDRLRQEDLALNELERQRLTAERMRQLERKRDDAAGRNANP